MQWRTGAGKSSTRQGLPFLLE